MQNANEIGRHRQITALLLTAKYGHLRPSDLAIHFSSEGVPWPKKIAERTYRSLYQKGLLIPRANALGCTSYVLSAAGARQLQNLSHLKIKTGKDLTTTGPSFIHRTLGSMGLIILENLYKQYNYSTMKTYSEYEMQRGLGVIDARGRIIRLLKEEIHEITEHIPDGIIETNSGVIDWLEVEASWKNTERLRTKLEWLAAAFQDEYQQFYGKNDLAIAQLRRVIWVIPAGEQWFDHEARLRKQITRLNKIPSAEWFILRLHVTQRLNLTSYELIKINS